MTCKNGFFIQIFSDIKFESTLFSDVNRVHIDSGNSVGQQNDFLYIDTGNF